MIGISAAQFSLDGAILLERTQRPDLNLIRRVTRTATLDGGATFTDTGYSDADRTIEVTQERATRDEYEKLRFLMKNFELLILCQDDGAYLGAMSQLLVEGGDVTVVFLVREKKSA